VIDVYNCCLADHHTTLALLTATSLATVGLSQRSESDAHWLEKTLRLSLQCRSQSKLGVYMPCNTAVVAVSPD